MGVEKMRIDLDVETGDTIRIIGGPFEWVSLRISPDKRRYRCSVEDTPVRARVLGGKT